MMHRSALVSQIAGRPPLHIVSGARELIAGAGRVLALNAGERLITRGDSADALLIPISPGLCFDADGPANPAVPIATFDVLGMREILDDVPYSRGVRAEAMAFVVAVPRHEVLSTIRKTSSIEHCIRLTTASDCLRRLVRQLSERSVARSDIVRLLATIRTTPLKLEKNAIVPAQPSIWFVEEGEIVSSTTSEQPIATRLTRATFFGGECLVRPFERMSPAIAATDALLYEMPTPEARTLIAELSLTEFFLADSQPGSRTAFSTASVPACVALPGRVVDPVDVRHFGRGVPVDSLTCANTSTEDANVSSVANLLRFLGIAVSLSSLRASLSHARFSYLQIAEVIETYGVVARPARVGLPTLHRRALPALLALRGRLCVLLAIKAGRQHAVLHDPARGLVTMSLIELASVWDGVLLEAVPVPVEARSEPTDAGLASGGPTVKTILSLLAEQRPLIASIALLSLLTICLSIVHPYLSQIVLDEVLTLRDHRALLSCASGMLLAQVLHAVIRWVQQAVFAEFVSGFDARLGELFYRHALRLPAGSFTQHKAGDILARLRELEDLRELLSFDSLGALLQLFSMVIVGVVLTLYSGAIAGLVVALAAAMVAFQFAIGGTLYRNSTRSARETTRAGSLLAEQVAAVSTVKSFGAARALRERWERTYLHSRELALRNDLLESGATALLQVLAATARIGGLWLAVRAALDETLTPGQVLAVSMYLDRVVDGIGDITGLLGRIWSVRTSFDNVRRILDAAPDAPWKKPENTLSMHLTGKIQIEGLGFRYDDHSAWVLRNVDLTIHAHQIVAIVGKSGCGKTTLAHLIAGNLRATTGRILYDGVDGGYVTQECLRRHIGFVTQTYDLFQGTLVDNISFADDAPRLEQIARVADDACLTPFVTQIPGGLSSVLGEGGTGLSGGQLQRVSIARTLYRDPSIFIFDEATSQLDTQSEHLILDNLRRSRRRRTSIIIAHRLSTVRHADWIFVMKDQTVVEQGTHEQLLARGGHYTELFSSTDMTATSTEILESPAVLR
jgi:ATP-binding cassette, subfamily B, bacterial HlyB/CyaB